MGQFNTVSHGSLCFYHNLPLIPTVLWGPKEPGPEGPGGKGCKPGSVVHGHLSGTAVARGLKRPILAGAAGPGKPSPQFGLAPGGVCRATSVSRGAGGLLPHRFTLASMTLPPWGRRIGGLFSVALSVALRRPGVTWHPALRCPDFPHPLLEGATVPPSQRYILAYRWGFVTRFSMKA